MEHNPILRELTDSDIDLLVSAGNVRRLQAGTEIIREGVETPSLFILLSGTLAVFAGKPQKHLADLSPGELVGEMAFVDQRSSSAIVRATTESEVLAISREGLEVIISKDAAFGARFFRGIASLVVRRLRATIQHLGYNERPSGVAVQLDRRLLDKIAAKSGRAVV